MKEQKATKTNINEAVKVLLNLKEQYKDLTGTDWKPGCISPSDAPVSNKTAVEINEAIIQQGNSVRKLKENKASKVEIDLAVKQLLGLKSQYKKISGAEWKPTSESVNVSSASKVSIEV